MQYPLISEYIDAIRNAEDNFDKLSNLRPVLDYDGNPIMSSGNFAVVFKMTDGEKFYAIKCFLKEQPNREKYYSLISNYLDGINSSYLVKFKYLKNELFVNSQGSIETDYPVVVMEWIDGCPLDEYYNECYLECDSIDERNKMYLRNLLSYNFFHLIKWLIASPFAHGDIKPDNILVGKDSSIHLIDYDGMFVPDMEGLKPIENGTPNYRNPNKNSFDKTIDDYALISIMLSILCSQKTYHEITIEEYIHLSKSDWGKEIFAASSNIIIKHFLALYMLIQTSNFRLSESLLQIELDKPKWYCQTESYECAIDKYGVIYSVDYHTLLHYHIDSIQKKYVVKDLCQTIAENAFAYIFDPDPEFGLSYYGNKLQTVILPRSLKRIGNGAFGGCSELLQIKIPDSVEYIGDYTFESCTLVKHISLPKNLTFLGKEALPNSLISFNSKSKSILVEESKEGIPYLYSKEQGILILVHRNADSFTIPNNLRVIDSYAFGWCNKLHEKLSIPKNILEIRGNAFWGSSVKSIIIEGYKCCFADKSFALEPTWGRKYINGYSSIEKLIVPYGRSSYYKKQLEGCTIEVSEAESLKSIYSKEFYIAGKIKDKYGVIYNEDMTVLLKADLSFNQEEYIVHKNTKVIESNAFARCESLKQIKLPDGLKSIGDNAFWCCYKLEFINLPDSIEYIGDYNFTSTLLRELQLPRNLCYLGKNPIGETPCVMVDGVFNRYCVEDGVVYDLWTDEIICCGTKSSDIIIKSGTAIIGEYAFWGQESIKTIEHTNSISEIKECAFYGCHNLMSFDIPCNLRHIGWAAFGETNLHEKIRAKLNLIDNEGHLFSQIEDLPF